MPVVFTKNGGAFFGVINFQVLVTIIYYPLFTIPGRSGCGLVRKESPGLFDVGL